MKKPFLAFIVFLTLGLFQVSESIAVEVNTPKATILTDSILKVKINSSESVQNLQSHIETLETKIEMQNEKIEHLSSQEIPWWLLGLTLINTIGIICFALLKYKKKSSTKQNHNPKQDGNTMTDNSMLKNNQGEAKIGHNNVTTAKVHSTATYRKEDNPRNVVATTYGKNDYPISQQQAATKNKERRKLKLHRFANFMIDNGRISTLERTISDDSSDKLFCIDYEEGANVATYAINPECKALILSDIQTFQNYVAKFNITGNPTDIVVKQEGHLNKVGKQWVVTEKLVVEFK